MHAIAPPDPYAARSARPEHQIPAAGSTGVLSALFAQVREELRNGTAAPLEPVSAIIVKPWPRPQAKTALPVPVPEASAPPTLRKITSLDLRETDRLLILHEQAVEQGLIGPSEAERLTFVALAQHVLWFRPDNAGGLFRQLLRSRRYQVITQEDEDTAQQRLKRFLYGEAVPSGPSAHPAGGEP
jgi:hypothetical protein